MDWQCDNCSLKVDDSCSIRAQCATQDEWVLQVLPEWAPVSWGFVSAPNKYMPVFHYVSKFSISLQTKVFPVASECQCHVPAQRICSSCETSSQNATKDVHSASAEERVNACAWTRGSWRQTVSRVTGTVFLNLCLGTGSSHEIRESPVCLVFPTTRLKELTPHMVLDINKSETGDIYTDSLCETKVTPAYLKRKQCKGKKSTKQLIIFVHTLTNFLDKFRKTLYWFSMTPTVAILHVNLGAALDGCLEQELPILGVSEALVRAAQELSTMGKVSILHLETTEPLIP